MKSTQATPAFTLMKNFKGVRELNLNKEVLDDLWSGEKSICFFVSGAKCYWVLDYKYNFSLDAEKDYRAYLDKGHITQAQYEEACRVFRGGILKLTADNFSQYLNSVSEGVLTGEDLSKILSWMTTVVYPGC